MEKIQTSEVTLRIPPYKIRKITMAISSDLSPLPFRPEDFTINNPFVREILETGINII